MNFCTCEVIFTMINMISTFIPVDVKNPAGTLETILLIYVRKEAPYHLGIRY